MAVSRYSRGKDGRSPYERQKGRICDMEVVPFGEVVLHRLPEVATERPQALEERWANGGVVGTGEGVQHISGGHRQRSCESLGDQAALGE